MPTALITGASTGIGRATALRLAASGWSVYAGIRDVAAGEALVREAADASAAADGGARGGVVPLTLDVTEAGQIEAAAARIVAEVPGGALDALVNNAGVAVGGPLETLPLADLRAQLEVNLLGQVAVTQALIAALRRARGRIVLISSIGGRVTTPFTVPYHASKYALEAIGNGLRLELASSQIQVALIEPGSVKTPIWDKGEERLDGLELPEDLRDVYGHVPEAMRKTLRRTSERGVPPERVAATIERALTARRMRTRYVVGVDARGMLLMSRLLPDRVFDGVIRRAVGV